MCSEIIKLSLSKIVVETQTIFVKFLPSFSLPFVSGVSIKKNKNANLGIFYFDLKILSFLEIYTAQPYSSSIKGSMKIYSATNFLVHYFIFSSAMLKSTLVGKNRSIRT